MDDRVRVECPHCGKGYMIPSDRIGRRANCKGCGQAFELTAGDPDDLLAGIEPEPTVIAEPAHLNTNGPPAHTPPPSSTGGGGLPPWLGKDSILVKAGLVLFIILCLAVGGWFKWNSIQRRHTVGTRIGERLAAPAEPPAPPPVIAQPPVTPPPAATPPVKLAFTTTQTGTSFAAGKAARRGKSTHVRIYLPPGASAEAKVPCVFIAPAGSNLLVGVPFGDDEYDDFLPLLRHGIAVCFYTLDGTVDDLQQASEMVLAVRMMQYVDSRGGMANLSDAIDTVLASTDAVDPDRLATCGHSSAGTIALMALAREPRIAAAAVMAPAIDLPNRLGDEFLIQAPPDLKHFCNTETPSAIDGVDRPVLIVHAPDDQNTPYSESEDFARKHAGHVAVTGTTGGHTGAYNNGRPLCFSFLAEKLKATPVEMAALPTGEPKAAAAAPNPPERRPATPPQAPAPPARPVVGFVAELDAPQADDQPFETWSAPVQGARLITTARLDGFVVREHQGFVEILRPSQKQVAPRLRIYAIADPVATLRGGRLRRAEPPEGFVSVSVPERAVDFSRRQETSAVKFLNAENGARRCISLDRDHDRLTRESCTFTVVGQTSFAFHVITSRDDDAAFDMLQNVVDTLTTAAP